MQKKTLYVVSITISLLLSMLVLLAYNNNYDNISDLLVLLWLIAIVSLVHYFISINPIARTYNENTLVIKDILIRSTYSRLLCFIGISIIISWYIITNKHFIEISERKYHNENLLMEQEQKKETQLQINKGIIAVAKILNIVSWSISTELKSEIRVSIGDSMSISGDNNKYYYLGTTTWLDKDFIYLVWMEKKKWFESLKVITTSQESQDNFCKKVKIEDSKRNLRVIYNFAPQCLSACEKFQQIIIKWAQFLSKEDLAKVSPSCAESFSEK